MTVQVPVPVVPVLFAKQDRRSFAKSLAEKVFAQDGDQLVAILSLPEAHNGNGQPLEIFDGFIRWLEHVNLLSEAAKPRDVVSHKSTGMAKT